MARRLNIERRRKQIRHYRARRRRRSPAWRALLFWWAPAIVCALTFLALAAMLTGFSLSRPGVGPESRYRLPGAGMRLVRVPQEQANAWMRAGNARRVATAPLGDAEVGISLGLPLPEPGPLARGKALAHLSRPAAHGETGAPSPGAALPPAWETPAGAPAEEAAVRLRADAALAGFRAEVRPPPGRGSATFWVELGADGRPTTVLRFAPAGAETAPLRALRTALLRGRGRGRGQGEITVHWGADARKERGR